MTREANVAAELARSAEVAFHGKILEHVEQLVSALRLERVDELVAFGVARPAVDLNVDVSCRAPVRIDRGGRKALRRAERLRPNDDGGNREARERDCEANDGFQLWHIRSICCVLESSDRECARRNPPASRLC